MAHESFEDDTVAALLNEYFVPVKVDREERPDVDDVYMSACQITTGSGGWPLSAFLTPDLKPFYIGTYFPKNDMRGRMGFISLISRIADLWMEDRESLVNSAAKITGIISEVTDSQGGLESTVVEKTAAAFMSSYDTAFGGYGRAPKFPSPHTLMFLAHSASTEPKGGAVWDSVVNTLRCMAAGGIRDHVGGGFCRYSTDTRWLVPHFEKMLYDNALLCMAYTEAYQKTGEFGAVIDEIIDYVFYDLRSPDSLFYTARDADSEGGEGFYYIWTPSEIRETLGIKDGERFCGLYDITEKGNFENRNIPNLIGKTLSQSDVEFARRCLTILREARAKRTPPMRDEKILLTSNSLMCAALAKAGFAMSNRGYIEAAKQCEEKLIENANGELSAVRGSSHKATLDGYSYYIWALLELYHATGEDKYLNKAEVKHMQMIELFSGDNGMLYYTFAEDLPVRGINAYDGATPSGQSAAANNMLRLERLTGNPDYGQQLERLLNCFSNTLNSSGQALSWMVAAIAHMRHGGTDVKLAQGKGESELVDTLRGFNPFLTLRYYDGDNVYKPIGGKAAAYVCSGMTCKPPVTEADALRTIIMA